MKQYQSWVLLTLALAALPSLLTLPIWVAAVATTGAALHYIGPLRRSWYGKAVGAALLGSTVLGIWFSFTGFFSGQAVLSFFIAVVFLKWAESRNRRDYLLLIFAAVILACIGALYWENLWSLLHMLVVIFALTVSLVAIYGDPSILSRLFALRFAGQLVVLALPIMLLLFLTFPRIPGPLWDIGLAFGLPVKALMDRGDGDYGKETTLAPGATSDASKDDQNVLVAEFKGAVPFKSRLYWRGPVFYDFDGENWNLPDGWNNRNRLLRHAIRSKEDLDRELRWSDTPVRYTIRVMPNGGRWLYGLDVPAAPAPEAFISEDFQLLSIRSIDDQEPKFPMLAYLDYHIGSELTDEQRARALAWPGETNPRLRKLGAELAAKYADSEELVVQIFSLLRANDYQFDAGHLLTPGPDLLDRYFFDEKRGGAEYLAGSFVMLLRASGVPARLVSGYRGGTIIALTNFVIVKRSDAHVWAEVWHEGKGWVRAEPKDIVLPPDKKPTEEKQEQPAEITEVKIETPEGFDAPQPEQSTTTPKPAAVAKEHAAPPWELPDFASLLGGLQKWVIQYDPDRQMDILQGVGLEEGNWMDLLIGGVLGMAGLLSLYLLVAWLRGRPRLDPVTKAWGQFCDRLQKLGLTKTPQECPRSFQRRACQEKPELADALNDIIGRYIDIRYGSEHSPEAISNFKRQVERFVAMS